MIRTAISVVIPCYRQAHFLPAAVESVLGQSCTDVETIVVNDGSDDNTDEIAARYLPRIRLIKKPNGGLSSARNAGIAAATGTYMLFLDADDSLHPRAIEKLRAALNRPDDGAIMGYIRFADGTAPETGEHQPVPPFTQFLAAVLQGNLAPPNCWLLPRAMIRRVGGFCVDLRSHEDWDLWIRLALVGLKLNVVPFAGAYYRLVPGSMSSNLSRMRETHMQVLARAFEALEAARPAHDCCAAFWAAAAYGSFIHGLLHSPKSPATARLGGCLAAARQIFPELQCGFTRRVLYPVLGVSRTERLRACNTFATAALAFIKTWPQGPFDLNVLRNNSWRSAKAGLVESGFWEGRQL